MNKTKIFLLICLFLIIFVICSKINYEKKYTVDNSHLTSVSIRTIFPADYIKAHRGSVLIEIPKIFELLNIVIALSNIDEEYSSLTNKETAYYQSVIAHFEEYKDHPAVEEIKKANEEMGYSNLRNMFIYELNDNSINHGGIYSSDFIQRGLDEYVSQLESFANLSDFNDFYDKNQNYYNDIVEDYRENIPVKQMWKWLENNYPNQYDTYKIIMSPLIGGAHNTFAFEDIENNYSEIVMFVSTPDILNKDLFKTEAVEEGLISRMLFTEIDHNYVNPVTDQTENIKNVIKSFSDTSKWHKGSGYNRPALIFM